MTSHKSIILRNNDIKIYADNEDGIFQIYIHYFTNNKDEIWVRGKYSRLKTLIQSDFWEKEKYYYVILESIDGSGSIVDLISGNTIFNNFYFEDYIGCHKYEIKKNGKWVNHFDIRFNNKRERTYSVYSTSDIKFIIGPIKYETIEIYRNGVILDKDKVIEKDGRILDLSEYNYSERSRVYINKEKKRYLVKFDYDGMLFHDLHNSREKGILTVRLDRTSYFYNIAEDRLYKKGSSQVWSKRELAEAEDVAYEGYSRSELGLE